VTDPGAETPEGDGEGEARRSRRFGWTALLVWASLGLALEAAHGFKLAWFLDDDLRRTLLRLAHAHGVVLALVVLAHASSAGAARVRSIGRLLRAGALLMPIGFALSALRPSEGDPGVAIALVPIGALALLAGLAGAALRTWRS
jgi:hypothetical protein